MQDSFNYVITSNISKANVNLYLGKFHSLLGIKTDTIGKLSRSKVVIVTEVVLSCFFEDLAFISKFILNF